MSLIVRIIIIMKIVCNKDSMHINLHVSVHELVLFIHVHTVIQLTRSVTIECICLKDKLLYPAIGNTANQNTGRLLYT